MSLLPVKSASRALVRRAPEPPRLRLPLGNIVLSIIIVLGTIDRLTGAGASLWRHAGAAYVFAIDALGPELTFVAGLTGVCACIGVPVLIIASGRHLSVKAMAVLLVSAAVSVATVALSAPKMAPKVVPLPIERVPKLTDIHKGHEAAVPRGGEKNTAEHEKTVKAHRGSGSSHIAASASDGGLPQRGGATRQPSGSGSGSRPHVAKSTPRRTRATGTRPAVRRRSRTTEKQSTPQKQQQAPPASTQPAPQAAPMPAPAPTPTPQPAPTPTPTGGSNTTCTFHNSNNQNGENNNNSNSMQCNG